MKYAKYYGFDKPTPGLTERPIRDTTGNLIFPGHPEYENALRQQKRWARNKARRERDQVMRDMGMVKVRGNLGGTYWE